MDLKQLRLFCGVVDAELDDIAGALARAERTDGDGPLALALRWDGAPAYPRLRAAAEAIARALPRTLAGRQLLALLLDGDVGMTIGRILKQEIAPDAILVSLDGLQLKEFDYVDIGALQRPAGVATVVIKSLLF